LGFRRRLEPGTWSVALQSRLNVDLVVNPALVIKTLQIRQQGRLRELHRFWCWPQRSSHGQDQLGYRPCTLTRGPAPKSTTTLILCLLLLILSPEIARRSSQKSLNHEQTRVIPSGLMWPRADLCGRGVASRFAPPMLAGPRASRRERPATVFALPLAMREGS
jgi:hypothetical protein